MPIVPEFLIKRIYQKGSLKKEAGKITLILKNVLGPGFISGFDFIRINDSIYNADKVKFITQGKEFNAKDITERTPIAFRLGQEGKIILDGIEGLIEGLNKITIEAFNPEAGRVSINIQDNFAV